MFAIFDFCVPCTNTSPAIPTYLGIFGIVTDAWRYIRIGQKDMTVGKKGGCYPEQDYGRDGCIVGCHDVSQQKARTEHVRLIGVFHWQWDFKTSRTVVR
jgi:hypothetical protein